MIDSTKEPPTDRAGALPSTPDRPLRILAIAPTAFYADYGCHVRIRGQMSTLIARGHSVRLVTYPSGRDVAGLRTVRPPIWPRGRSMPVGSSWRKLLLDLPTAAMALQTALRFPGGPPDVIHSYLHEGALMGAAVGRLLSRPLIMDFQGSLTAEMLDHRFLPLGSPLLGPLRRLEGWIDRRPQAIVASSAHAARLLVARYGVSPARVHCLPDSVDPALFRPRRELPAERLAALRERLGLPAGRPLLVYLGLLAPYQGTELLLQAIRQLADWDQAGAPFALVMGFPHLDHYRQLAAAMGLSDHVRFTGPVAYEEAPLHLALGDVAVAPKLSATEGSGKLLPYMAAALPVAAFDTPAHREYLGALGYYAPAGDATGLATAIAQTLAAPGEAARRGLYGRRQVVMQHTWHHAGHQIEGLYRALCR